MDYLFQYGLFLAKTITFVAAILIVISAMVNVRRHLKEQAEEQLDIRHLNRRFEHMAEILYHALLPPPEFKQHLKKKKQEDKKRAKETKLGKAPSPRVFVLDFEGDIKASGVDHLRVEISALLQIADKQDEVLVRLESPGGMVHSYGLAASQLRRLRDRGVRLTVAVDKVAASGGYMMACVADRIIAAPFAVIGSIGVVAQLPNFNRLLRKHEVDFELHTAGQHKRTLTLFGENTEEARAKFREELEEAHGLFKQFLRDNRSQVDVERVATGEHWYGTRALELKLVDKLQTSDDYLLEASKERELFEVHYKARQKLSQRLMHGIRQMRENLLGT